MLLASDFELQEGSWIALRGQRDGDLAPFEAVIRTDYDAITVWMARGDENHLSATWSVAVETYGLERDPRARTLILEQFLRGVGEKFDGDIDEAFGDPHTPCGISFAEAAANRVRPILNVRFEPEIDVTLNQKARAIEIVRDKKGRMSGAIAHTPALKKGRNDK
jgi:hypothetical protein